MITKAKSAARKIAIGQLIRVTARSYGELVLRPVTIAERVVGAEIAFSPSNNKK